MDGTVLAGASAPAQDFDAAKADVRSVVEDFLGKVFARQPDSEVARAASYAVLGGGHRWRALVAVAAGKIFRDDALDLVLPAACGVELAHAASLVLDDLPSMDDASVRRGKPCIHRVFPGWAADMVPVFLVTLAYQISLDNPSVAPSARVTAALALSKAGLMMIRGQVHDMRQDLDGGATEEERLLRCYRLKSAALYGAAAKMGGILTGASDAEAASLQAAGVDLGLSYQFLDDVADVVAGVAEVGKEQGMDAAKQTAVDLYGLDGARRKALEFQAKSLSQLERFGAEADWLRNLVCEASWKAS
jgi:geranylgeranyl pyrophosphate synthase